MRGTASTGKQDFIANDELCGAVDRWVGLRRDPLPAMNETPKPCERRMHRTPHPLSNPLPPAGATN
jgi:hypothetical protein